MSMLDLTRTRMWRLMQLDRKIKAGSYPNCSSFARELAAQTGMKRPFDRKTIQRDIDFLRDQLRAPIEYDQTRKGYFYTDQTWSFPMLDLTEGELLQLLLAKQMAALFAGTPLAHTLDSLFAKIRFNLADSVPVDPVIARQQFSFHGHPVRPISKKVWEKIFQAMRKDRVLAIKYMGIKYNEPCSRDVEPLHLACVDGEWYLVAYCRLRGTLRHFAVSRIKTIKTTNQVFAPRDFDPDAYFANRFGRFIGPPDKEQWVTVKFALSATPWIRERIWHPKQKLKQHEDGCLSLSFPAPSLFEAKRWVLQWGAEAEVLEPKELREMVRAELQVLLEKNMISEDN